MLKICALAIVCVVVCMLLKHIKSDFASLIRIAGGVLIFGILIVGLGDVMGEAAILFQNDRAERYITVMLRALGIAFLTRICTDMCRDCGENLIAGGVEAAGKAAILVLCIPLIGEIIGYATEILQLE